MTKMMKDAKRLFEKISKSKTPEHDIINIIHCANIIGSFNTAGLIKVDDSELCNLCIKFLDESNGTFDASVMELCKKEGLLR